MSSEVTDASDSNPPESAHLLAAQNAILEGIARGHPLAETLDAVARLADARSRDMNSTILLVEEGRMRHGAAPHVPDAYSRAIDGLPIGPQAGSCGTAAYTKRPVVVTDIATDPLWNDYRHLALPHGLRACWSTPILDLDGRVLGTFAMYYREPKAPPQADRRIVQMATHLAGIAIERARSRLKLERSEARFRTLAQASTNIVWTHRGDGTVEQLSALSWQALTGQSLEELAGYGWLACLHPEDREEARRQWDESLATGRPHRSEHRVRLATGTYAWMLCRAFPVRGPDGGIREWVGSVSDVTPRRRAEERLQCLVEAGARLVTLAPANTLDDLAGLLVPRIADFCTVFLKNGNHSVALGELGTHADGASRRLSGAERMHMEQMLLGAIEKGRMLVKEVSDEDLKALAKDDASLDWLRSLSLRSFAAVPLIVRGEPTGVITLATARNSGRALEEDDVALADLLARRIETATENALLYEEAQAAIRTRDEFLSIASHEMKTPLTPLLLQLETIRRGRKEGVSEWLQSKLRIVEKQGHRLSRLVDQLLDVSRISAGRITLEPENLDLGELVREVTERVRESGEASRYGCELIVDGEDGVVGRWDRLRVDQVLTNLVQNALKYGDSRPVHVSWRRNGEHVRLSVRDEGIGIEPEDQERVFLRFERAAPVGRYAGMGIGLFIVRQIVEAMGGRIFLRSAPHKGSEFSVELPFETPTA